MRKKIVAGNWKMNKTFQEGIDLSNELVASDSTEEAAKELIICPPFIHLAKVAELLKNSSIHLGAQNCHTEAKGAFTGEISATMLNSIGVDYCLVGHSERRSEFFEDNTELTKKMKQLLSNNIKPIFCCGELLEDRKEGGHFDLIKQQLEVLWEFSKEDFGKMVIAYEPVWAIGTGETATAAQAQEIHAFIRKKVETKHGKVIANDCTILYGGSCKPTNAAELFAKSDVDGGLIGGAALDSTDFLTIFKAL